MEYKDNHIHIRNFGVFWETIRGKIANFVNYLGDYLRYSRDLFYKTYNFPWLAYSGVNIMES